MHLERSLCRVTCRESAAGRIATRRRRSREVPRARFRTIIRPLRRVTKRSAVFRPASSLRSDAPGVSRPHVQAERKNSPTSRKYTISHQRSRARPLARLSQPVFTRNHFYSRASAFKCHGDLQQRPGEIEKGSQTLQIFGVGIFPTTVTINCTQTLGSNLPLFSSWTRFRKSCIFLCKN